MASPNVDDILSKYCAAPVFIVLILVRIELGYDE